MINRRRERIQRLAAKRPAVTIEVTHEPCSIAKARLVDLLLELLDEQRRSGRR